MESTTRKVNGRYEAGLLWKRPTQHLPNNRDAALRRFYALEKFFQKDPTFGSRYGEVIEESLRLGHARRLEVNDLIGPPGATWYLLHHGILNSSNKLRVVFDTSASFQGTKLNDKLLEGPDYLTPQFDVILRFRENAVAVSSDVEKMFHQVRVGAADRPALRFLWRTLGSVGPPGTYEMQVKIFGAVCSPTTYTFVLQKTARDNDRSCPGLERVLIEDFYVDNFQPLIKARTRRFLCRSHCPDSWSSVGPASPNGCHPPRGCSVVSRPKDYQTLS